MPLMKALLKVRYAFKSKKQHSCRAEYSLIHSSTIFSLCFSFVFMNLIMYPRNIIFVSMRRDYQQTPFLKFKKKKYSKQVFNKISNMESLKTIELRAVQNLEKEKYHQCKEDILEASKILSNSHLRDTLTSKSLIFHLDQLRELQAPNLKNQQMERIRKRGEECIGAAVNVLRNHQYPELSQYIKLTPGKKDVVNLQQIFLLRSFRRVVKNWAQNTFSLNSLEVTTDLAFTMVKTKPKQFSVLPLHIIHYFMRPQNSSRSFKEINKEVEVMLGCMCKKYPPNDISMSQSMINSSDIISFQQEKKINLFQKERPFRQYKELHKAIEGIAKKAQQEIKIMEQICRDICLLEYEGKEFKINLKLAEIGEQNMLEERILCRIVEKMLSVEIQAKAEQFYSSIKMAEKKTVSDYIKDVRIQWQNTINVILKEKMAANQPVKCYVYDLMRAKCTFQSIKQISMTVKEFWALDSRGQIKLLEVNNRLNLKTKDVVLKFRVNEVVGELQLSLQFESSQNEFNHGLYELYRSPFGCFFASAMWFSGFALKKNKFLFQDRSPWSLPKAPNLRKFVYEDQLSILLDNFSTRNQANLRVVDFEVTSRSLICHFMNEKGYFYYTEEGSDIISLKKQKPDSKFVIETIQDSFKAEEHEFIPCQIRVQNQSRFISVHDGSLHFMTEMDKADTTVVQIKDSSKDYEAQIKECRKNEKIVISKIKD